MGVARRSRAEASAGFEEAITILRAVWGDGDPIRVHGAHYTVDGLKPGPVPAHLIEIWTGAQGPKALALIGRIADGWAAPILSYLPYEQWPAANAILDETAVAGRRRSAATRSSGRLWSHGSRPSSRSTASCSGRSTRPWARPSGSDATSSHSSATRRPEPPTS